MANGHQERRRATEITLKLNRFGHIVEALQTFTIENILSKIIFLGISLDDGNIQGRYNLDLGMWSKINKFK